MAGGSQRLWLLLLGVLLTVVCLSLISPVSCRPTRDKREQESDYSLSSSWGSSSSQEWQDSESFADSMSSVFTSHEGYSGSTDSSSSDEDEEPPPPPPPRKKPTPAKKKPTNRRPSSSLSSSVMLKLESVMLLVPVGVLIRTMYPI